MLRRGSYACAAAFLPEPLALVLLILVALLVVVLVLIVVAVLIALLVVVLVVVAVLVVHLRVLLSGMVRHYCVPLYPALCKKIFLK